MLTSACTCKPTLPNNEVKAGMHNCKYLIRLATLGLLIVLHDAAAGNTPSLVLRSIWTTGMLRPFLPNSLGKLCFLLGWFMFDNTLHEDSSLVSMRIASSKEERQKLHLWLLIA